MRTIFFLVLLSISFVSTTQAANRLAHSDSPYLRIHGANPVDWYPWGHEAFEKAKNEDKPIFLSIGYSACYWCRVAEETLYRNPEIAALMNAAFVNVKVDREERPDLDKLYAVANQLLGGPGGWPNNLFLTPERKPFHAGSYYPPEDDGLGNVGFATLLRRIDAAWKNDRSMIEALAEQISMSLRDAALPPMEFSPMAWKRRAVADLLAREDRRHGGLKNHDGTAKFPSVPELTLLNTVPEGRGVVRRALEAMVRSALFDAVGGGFHRYTIDTAWNMPHFEKMLYDNAQLLRLYASEWQGALQHDAARATAAFMLTRLQAPEGGFYASLDAVSDGREGAHYLWQAAEIQEVLGPKATRFLAAYDIVPKLEVIADETFESRGVLRRRDEMQQGLFIMERQLLLRHRDLRPAPSRDEKIIVGWNGLAIEALAHAGRKLSMPNSSQAARKAAERLWRDAWDPGTGRLHHMLVAGRAQGEGFLEDYAHFGLGLLAVGEQERAKRIAEAMLVRFARSDGGLMESVHGAEMFAPLPETGDGPYPCGASAAYRLLTLLAREDAHFLIAAEKLLVALSPVIAGAPERWPSLLAMVPDGPALTKFTDAASSARQATHGSADVITVRARWQNKNRWVVNLRIAPGWHINANPASFDYLIPTRLDFSGAWPSVIRYPRSKRFRAAFSHSEIDVYAGKVTIEVEFEAERPQAARLQIQACSTKVCLPPAELTLDPSVAEFRRR